MALFTSDAALNASIAAELSLCGCCSRCIMRYLGLSDMHLYRGDIKEMQSMVEGYINAGTTTATEPEAKPSDADITENNASNSSVTDGKTDTDTETNVCSKPDVDITENSANRVTDAETNVCSKSDVDITENSANRVTDAETNVCSKSDDIDMVDENSSGDNTGSDDKITTPEDTTSCVVCLGILQSFAEEEFLKKVVKYVKDEGFHYTIYMCSLMIPVCIIPREHAILLHLKEKFESVYKNKTQSEVSTVKDVWKWRCGPLLCELLGAPFDSKSPFDIILTFNSLNSNKECSFLLDTPDNDTFRKRKQDRRFNRKKPNFAIYNRANVAKALKDMSEEQFKRSYQCPPIPALVDTTCEIKCQNENVYLGGRYNKYSRLLSQSPWIIDGVRKSESSVEELICTEINKNFKPDASKFSSSGREDVDVLMLGNGRPFVVELMNPRRREFTQEEINDIEMRLNACTADIKCRDLQIVSKDDTNILKEGEIDKVKQYRALCWCKEPVSDEQLNQLSQIKELTIMQKTPIRVLHRRPLATRDRLIHKATAVRVDEHHFNLDMSTQAGTYIKEFIHGDFGRTKPNCTILLGQDCDILELDVTAVELDWPKQLGT